MEQGTCGRERGNGTMVSIREIDGMDGTEQGKKTVNGNKRMERWIAIMKWKGTDKMKQEERTFGRERGNGTIFIKNRTEADEWNGTREGNEGME